MAVWLTLNSTPDTDQVTLRTGLGIQNQSIGVSSSATGFNDVDGILGMGPVDLTSSTVASTTSVTTVTDNLFKQGTIPVESIGISYVPTTSTTDAATGELTFGSTDASKFTGDISYVPITQMSPASNLFFQIGDPRSLNSTLGGTTNKIYLITADLGSNSGSGLDFIALLLINGRFRRFGFLQRFYSVFDTTNSRVSFATTGFAEATTN
ncbi:aspartic peptidase domain-containing protein [Mycena rosella]|uniref:Aspartic peptidase domain-containing protein n=1 Tax=Mycena rosella TaxID=1033263 RepID=A0AAD7H2S7_MYCRO|nr:aspartic peptidase domain-containing protein [Mycena rosella]